MSPKNFHNILAYIDNENIVELIDNRNWLSIVGQALRLGNISVPVMSVTLIRLPIPIYSYYTMMMSFNINTHSAGKVQQKYCVLLLLMHEFMS